MWGELLPHRDQNERVCWQILPLQDVPDPEKWGFQNLPHKPQGSPEMKKLADTFDIKHVYVKPMRSQDSSPWVEAILSTVRVPPELWGLFKTLGRSTIPGAMDGIYRGGGLGPGADHGTSGCRVLQLTPVFPWEGFEDRDAAYCNTRERNMFMPRRHASAPGL